AKRRSQWRVRWRRSGPPCTSKRSLGLRQRGLHHSEPQLAQARPRSPACAGDVRRPRRLRPLPLSRKVDLARPSRWLQSQVEEYRFVRSLQNNIPFQRTGTASGLLRDQSRTPRQIHQIENKVRGIARFVREIDPRDQSPLQPAHEYRDHQMRRLLVAVGTRHRPRLNRGKAEQPLSAHRHASVSFETRLQRLVQRVFWMVKFPVRIGLPDFPNGTRHLNSVAVENSPLNGDALAGDTFANQVVAVQPMETNLEIRPNRLRRGRLQTHL